MVVVLLSVYTMPISAGFIIQRHKEIRDALQLYIHVGDLASLVWSQVNQWLRKVIVLKTNRGCFGCASV